jgi:methyl-accepting chemotaxis protein
MSQQAAREIARNVEESNNKNASQLKGGMGGSGCSPELTKQATGTMVAVMGVVDKVNRALTTTGSGLFSDDSLLKIHENAKKTNDAALLNEYIAEQNYIINKYGTGSDNLSKGTTEYNELLVNRYTAQGTKDLEELNNKYIEVNNLIMDLIKVIQQQTLAVENMRKVMENLDKNSND